MRSFSFIIILIFTACLFKGQDTKHEIGLAVFYDRTAQDYIKFKGIAKENILYKNAFSFQTEYNRRIGKALLLRSAIAYARRGFISENTDYSADYIQFDESIGIGIYENRYILVLPYAGAYIGIPLNAKKRVKDNYFTGRTGGEKPDIGLETGVKLGFKLDESYRIYLIPRLQFGLSDVYRKYQYESRRNITFSLGVGITREF